MNEIDEKDLRQLLTDIKLMKGWEQVFFEKDAKNTIRANHQKGHIKDNAYVRHNDLHKKKPENQMQMRERQNRPRPDNKKPNEQTYHKPNRPQGMPRGPGGNRPPGGNMMKPNHPPMGNRPIGTMGPMPAMGAPTKIGGVPTPSIQMGGLNKPMGLPPMGMGMPPMGMGLPPMGMTPPIGMTPPMGMPLNLPPPQMGGMQIPKMGAPTMMPPQDKKL